MILEYQRPKTIDEALKLLARTDPLSLPLGGGTILNAPSGLDYALVDLQNLGLQAIETRGSVLQIGATASLQALLDTPGLQPDLARAIRLEATRNLRQVGSIAGTLVSADGRSPFVAAMLALDARVSTLPGEREIDLGDILQVRTFAAALPRLPESLITKIDFNTKTALSCQFVARSPADRPIVCVAAARWPAGRLRVVVGGWGSAPRLALDAPEPGGVEFAVRNATADAGDQWASAAYRQEAALTLAERALEVLTR